MMPAHAALRGVGVCGVPPVVLQLLEAVHALLRSGRTATQRDIYYSVSNLLEGLLSRHRQRRVHMWR
jgi:DNA topoisomerase VI subunit A